LAADEILTPLSAIAGASPILAMMSRPSQNSRIPSKKSHVSRSTTSRIDV
jgi:hypothetical protein